MPISLPRRGYGRYEPVSDINITPLVDVMLVLLIVFMVTAPMLAVGMRVDLPKATSAVPLEPKEPIVVTVTKQGNLFVGRDQVSRDLVAQSVRAKLGNERSRPIYLRGDRDAAYGEIVQPRPRPNRRPYHAAGSFSARCFQPVARMVATGRAAFSGSAAPHSSVWNPATGTHEESHAVSSRNRTCSSRRVEAAVGHPHRVN
jgi:biopolymer transport protein TolR